MILITRPRYLAIKTSNILRILGYNTLILPMLHLRYMYKEIFDNNYSFIIITSQNAVYATKHLGWLKKKRIYAVGAKTASLLSNINCKNIIVCDESKQNSKGMLDLIKSKENTLSKCLYISGTDVAGNLETELKWLGYDVNREIVYKSISTTHLSESAIDSINSLVQAVLFYSPRTATTFSRLTDKYQINLSNKIAVCISTKIANNLKQYAWSNILITKNSSEYSLMEVVNTNIHK